jgi:hypothetical protein
MIMELAMESLAACADGSGVADASLGVGADGEANPLARPATDTATSDSGAAFRDFASDCDASSRAFCSGPRAPSRLHAVSSAAMVSRTVVLRMSSSM